MTLQFCKIPVELEFYSHGVTDCTDLMFLITVLSSCLLVIQPYRTEWTEKMTFETSLLEKAFSMETESLRRIRGVFIPELVIIFKTGDTEEGGVLFKMEHEVFLSFE